MCQSKTNLSVAKNPGRTEILLDERMRVGVGVGVGAEQKVREKTYQKSEDRTTLVVEGTFLQSKLAYQITRKIEKCRRC